MSLVTLAEARALIKTSLTDVDLQAVIDREEAWLAGRIGALAGSRVLTVYPAYDATLLVPRRAASVAITDNAIAVPTTSYRYVADTGVIRRLIGYWTTPVAITLTPTDEADVEKGVINLIRLALDETIYESEGIGDYSYDKGETRVSRKSVVRSILRMPSAYSMRIRSSLEVAW